MLEVVGAGKGHGQLAKVEKADCLDLSSLP